MCAQETDSTLEALDDRILRIKLGNVDWENDSQYVSTEQVFRLFKRARVINDQKRIGLLSGVLSRRLLVLAKGFAVRSGVYPGNIDNLDQVAEEIAQFIWECLITRPGDAEHAERYFGQVFKRRALDFQRTLLAKKRKYQDNLEDAMNHLQDENGSDNQVPALSQIGTPDAALEAKQEHALIVSRLQTILSKEEYSVYVMLHVEEMRVKDIAAALDVTPRTVNNYKNNALNKIQKEFTK